MRFVTNKISTGNTKTLDDIIAEYKKGTVKTASTEGTVKVATKEKDEADSSGQPEAEGTDKFNNDPYKDPKVKADSKETAEKEASQGEVTKEAKEQDEADSSGQLKVEPHHQKGESTTLPKNGPKGKKDASEGTDTKVVKDDDDEEEKEATPDGDDQEEKEATAKGNTVKKAAECSCCGQDDCNCSQCRGCKACNASSEQETKEASSPKFVKMANLDGKSKTWLNDYWKNLYPPQYVDAMLADK